jgi:hypothetical protein
VKFFEHRKWDTPKWKDTFDAHDELLKNIIHDPDNPLLTSYIVQQKKE